MAPVSTEIDTTRRIDAYLRGSGIDAGRIHCIQKATHRFVPPSGQYRLTAGDGAESLDYIYSRNLINETKYYRILLYEWFCTVKPGGYIIIDFVDNDLLNYKRCVEEIKGLMLLAGKYRFAERHSAEDRHLVVIQKTGSVKRDPDEINQWTFGIVTNGKRKDLIEKAIRSIRALQIPRYEILLCGSYAEATGPDTVLIPFTERDDRGWITRKKNIICEQAKFENIVVMHDRIHFPGTWFDGMKRWGSYFDVLACDIFYPSKNITKLNWDTFGKPMSAPQLNRLTALAVALDPSDWDRYAYVGGPVIVIKRSVWEKEKWNERLYWGDWEDVEFSLRQSDHGVLLRFNPFITVISEIVTVPLMNFQYEVDRKKLGRLRMNRLLLFSLILLDYLGVRRNQRAFRRVATMLNRMSKARNWKMEDQKART
jgi:hypothetical protein